MEIVQLQCVIPKQDSPKAEYLLKDIDKRTVNFVPNFDDEEVEPTVLPCKIPKSTC